MNALQHWYSTFEHLSSGYVRATCAPGGPRITVNSLWSPSMESSAVSPDSPASSGEMPAIDFSRIDEVREKHELLIEYLQLKKLDSLLILDPANFAWLTGGADNVREPGGSPIAAILVTIEARVVLCNNVDSGEIFDKQLTGLGFLLKERPWTEDRNVLLNDVCRGRKTGCDTYRSATDFIGDDLIPFRAQLRDAEVKRATSLGAELAHALEATCRNFSLGSTESEVAGHLSHRLLKNRIEPLRIQVMADGQGWRYRHWKHGADQIERHCVISIMGRRDGLHMAATRTVSFETPSAELEEIHQLSTLIQATGIFFSRPEWAFQETWKRMARIYEKFGVPDEWRAAEQAELLGYKSCERLLTPTTTTCLQSRQLIHWHPSVRASAVGDTFLLNDSGIENLTPFSNWPVIGVTVKGTQIDRPGILIR